MFSKFTLILALIICLFSCESSNSEHNKEDISEKSQQNPGVAHGLSLEQEGHRRNYLLYLPKTYTGNKQYPLVFNFHGFGASHTNHMRYADLREKADSEGFILVYPEGITRQKGGNEWDPSPILQDSNIKNNDVYFIKILIEKLLESYAIDSQRIYAAGFSNGGMMAYGLACHLSDLIAAIVAVSASMLDATIESCNNRHPTAVGIIHGTSDQVLPYEGNAYFPSVEKAISFWLNDPYNNINQVPQISVYMPNVDLFRYEGGLSNQANVALLHYKVRGGRHIWYPFSNDVIWNLFSKYSLRGQLD